MEFQKGRSLSKMDCKYFRNAVVIYVVDLIQEPSPILKFERDLELAQEMYRHHSHCEPCQEEYEKTCNLYDVVDEYKGNRIRNLEIVIQSLHPN